MCCKRVWYVYCGVRLREHWQKLYILPNYVRTLQWSIRLCVAKTIWKYILSSGFGHYWHNTKEAEQFGSNSVFAVFWSASRLGNPVLVVDGQRFRRVGRGTPTETRVTWLCIKSDTGCRCYIVTVFGHVVAMGYRHEHNTKKRYRKPKETCLVNSRRRQKV